MKSFDSFNELNVPSAIKEALASMQFEKPTPIQAGAIPPALEGKDIIGTAQTGTGKTGAFGIPMLANIVAKPGSQALVLAPTRELAAQIHQVLRQMSRGTGLQGVLVVGGESFGRQRSDLSRKVDYIVATPGRLNDHLCERTVSLSKVTTLVLDEVDRMLDMGFITQIRDIVRHITVDRQTLLFSATLPPEVVQFMGPLVKNPERISVGSTVRPTSKVNENIIRLKCDEKTNRLLEILDQDQNGKALVFVRTQTRTYRLMRTLEQKGFHAVCLHGGRTQGQRKQALERFRNGSHPIMVATDLAGRGLDIADIDHVINFDVPATREDYIHRIGRTGRAGSEGTATSFVISGNSDEERVVTGKKPTPQGRPHRSFPPKPRWQGHSNGAPFGGARRRNGRRPPKFAAAR